MYAVIETGGKQYRVEVGTELEVELLDVAPGDALTFDRVLLVADGETAAIGRPIVSNASVAATVVGRERGEKVISFKYRPKARRRVKKGHRQELTLLRISDIVLDGHSAAADVAQAQEARARDRARLEEAARRQAAADAELAAKLAAAKPAAAEKPAARAVSAKPAAGPSAAKRAKPAAKPAKPSAKAAATKPAAAKPPKAPAKPAAAKGATAAEPATKRSGDGAAPKRPASPPKRSTKKES
jgi:large subunit ribosomal protein L21